MNAPENKAARSRAIHPAAPEKRIATPTSCAAADSAAIIAAIVRPIPNGLRIAASLFRSVLKEIGYRI
ncbi:hypothetical protein [Paenibacillus sp. GYB003]|uniref:hypothetical protein n=1 Tax=Paenibacillus sp. GYB003 TaxID=2994392 RepID=UPI002F96C7A0